jgi:hypothetical protein
MCCTYKCPGRNTTSGIHTMEKTLSQCQDLRQTSDGHFDTLSELFRCLRGFDFPAPGRRVVCNTGIPARNPA